MLQAGTARRRRIAARVADGDEVGTIAEALQVAPSTVRTHLKSVFVKLGVSRQLSVAQLVRGLPQMRP